MAEKTLPYVTAYGNITKALEKIQDASTPSRFTHDFLATKLGMSGGSARPVVPFLKRVGFIGSDGTPTTLYKQFRGTAEQRGAAAATALRRGYAPIYEINEYAHDLDESALKGLIVQVTGHEKSSRTVNLIAKSFKALNGFADHEATTTLTEPAPAMPEGAATAGAPGEPLKAINLGYTINLQLPPTSDVAVFDAIFKSLREHLLQ